MLDLSSALARPILTTVRRRYLRDLFLLVGTIGFEPIRLSTRERPSRLPFRHATHLVPASAFKYTPVRCCVVSTATPTLNNHHITGGFDIIRTIITNCYSVGHLIIPIRVSRKCFWLLRDNIQPYFRFVAAGS